MKLEYTIQNTDSYQTVKGVLKNHFHLSERLFSQVKRRELIFVNGFKAVPYALVHPGDIIEVVLDYPEDNSNIVPTKMPLDIVYEDEWYLVLNKPAGISTHPSMLHYENSLSNGVCYYFHEIDLCKKIRPIQRLDKNTSGLIFFAKNEYVQNSFSFQMQQGTLVKEYLTIIEGHLDKPSGTIDLPISRKEGSIMERIISTEGERAITKYEVVQETKDLSLVKCLLITGRTHQIRVHMKAIGHPVVGDFLYGTESPFIGRQALHSYHIKAKHPVTNTEIEYICPLPQDMEKLLSL